MKNIYLVLVILFTFTACSNKQVNTQNTQVSTSTQIQDNSSSDFEDEFADEFEDEKKDDFDPLSGYNKFMTSFNDKFYTYIAVPTAKGYQKVVPQTVRIGVSNFFDNLGFPIRFVNNILQLKFQNSWEELQRFVLNSTFGIAGLIDVAKENNFDMKKHNEDFGQTLAFYGVGEGFHIVLPILGPSNLRDTLGRFPDGFINPISQGDTSYYLTSRQEKSLGLQTLQQVNKSSFNPNLYENLKKDAIELYPFFKELYNQRREKEIKE